MESPCKTCRFLIIQEVGHRVFERCSDEKLKQGFEYDDFTYRHGCRNHTAKKECFDCANYSKPYCNIVYSKCDKEENNE